jgi:ankyrin repeat protein
MSGLCSRVRFFWSDRQLWRSAGRSHGWFTRPWIGQSVRVTTQHGSSDGSDDRALLALFDAIASRDRTEIVRRLDSSPRLASRPIQIAASRQDSETYFLAAIRHHVYAGDTALHLAAAAYQRELAESLVAKGANVRATNRRGAEPLHYAADGGPDTEHWDPVAQHQVITYLIGAGADPNALDKSAVAPLHRAVRNRCSAAASALIEGGADPRLRNRSGSTPLHLAVQNTGKSSSGSDACKDEQGQLISLLLRHGANPTDVDANGKSVAAAASSDWIRDVLHNP